MPRALKVSRARFAEMWSNPQMTSAQIAEAIGTARVSTVSKFAKAFGLPSRQPGPKPLIDAALFKRMWLAGVGVREMSGHFRISQARITQEARRAGHPPRQMRKRVECTITEFWERELLRRMRETERAEQAAMINAEMADYLGLGRQVGKDHARGLR